MIKEPLAFLEKLLLIGVFKVLLLLTLERRVVYASHEHIQANTYNKKETVHHTAWTVQKESIKLFYTLQGSRERKNCRKQI